MHTQLYEIEVLKGVDAPMTHVAATGTNDYRLWYFAPIPGNPLFLENATKTELSVGGSGWFEIDVSGCDHLAICGQIGFASDAATITIPASWLTAFAVGYPEKNNAIDGLPQATNAASSYAGWRGINLMVFGQDWIIKPWNQEPVVSATLTDSAIQNVLGSGPVSTSLEGYFQFWVGHRQAVQIGSQTAASNVQSFQFPSVSGLDKVFVQAGIGFTLTNGDPGNINVDFTGNLVAAKFRNVMSIDRKQAQLMGGKSQDVQEVSYA